MNTVSAKIMLMNGDLDEKSRLLVCLPHRRSQCSTGKG